MIIKRLFLSFWLILILFAGCKKETGCKPVSPNDEIAQIVEYNTKNGISAVKDNNGIYYQVLNSGTGLAPTSKSKVKVTYTGKLLNGTVFDSISTPKDFTLSQVIEGWQLGLPKITQGGRIILIIPSAYAYGCTGNSSLNIPSDKVLLFDLELLEVYP